MQTDYGTYALALFALGIISLIIENNRR